MIPLIIIPGYENALSHLLEEIRNRRRRYGSEKDRIRIWSLDELWALHGELSGLLSARIRAEKVELEKRLAALSRSVIGTDDFGDPDQMRDGKLRRKYPRVLPKYRNPHTSETWSGRGKRPRWLVAAVKSGRKIEDFRIGDTGAKARQRA